MVLPKVQRVHSALCNAFCQFSQIIVKRVQILCEIMSNLRLIHSMVSLLSLISNKSMMITHLKNWQRSSDLKDAEIFASRGMQHANKTVSQEKRSKISHEEKHWLVVMNTLDLVLISVVRNPPKRTQGNSTTASNKCHLLALPTEEKSWISWNSQQIENLDQKWSWTSRILGHPTGISSFSSPWLFERTTSSPRTIKETSIRCYLEYGPYLLLCSSKGGSKKRNKESRDVRWMRRGGCRQGDHSGWVHPGGGKHQEDMGNVQ